MLAPPRGQRSGDSRKRGGRHDIRFAFPTAILFGAGARRQVASHLATRAARVRSSSPIAGSPALPVFARFVAELARRHARGVLRASGGNPVRSQVMAGAAAFRAHRADSVIGIGGGAALDVAKAIALMANHPGDILEYAWDHPQVRPIDGRAALLRRPADDRGHGLGSRPLVGDLRRRDAHQEDHLLARTAREGRVRRSRADARPAAGDHRRNRHGRADAQRRIVPVARRTTRCATASRSRACASPRRAADRRARRPRTARRAAT